MFTQPLTSKELTSTISSKGQVTVPIKVRQHLGLGTSDKVAFVIEPTGQVKLTQATYPNIQSLRGVAGKLSPSMSWKAVKKVAHEDRLKNKYGT